MKTKLLALSIITFSLLNFFQTNIAYAHGEHKDRKNPKYFSGLNSESAEVVRKFHQALKGADVDTVRKILADDVIIFEGGGVERSLDEYAEHHMQADFAFTKEMQITLLEHHVKENANTAISMSRSHMKGRYKDKEIDGKSMETLLLRKTAEQWKIIHIHWSN